jgi:hypothetical protein
MKLGLMMEMEMGVHGSGEIRQYQDIRCDQHSEVLFNCEEVLAELKELSRMLRKSPVVKRSPE